MISLGSRDNRWEDVFDYNNNFLLVAYVVLMLYYVYVSVIYDGMCVRDMLNILCGDVFSTLMKIWLT